MEKRKRWHVFLIVAVLALTVYNILPTVFFYTKPLKQPVTEAKARDVASSSLSRVNSLEKWSADWVKSYLKLLRIKGSSLEVDPANTELFHVKFQNVKDAETFSQFFPRAGALIPFVPAQLSLTSADMKDPKRISIKRNIPLHFDTDHFKEYFSFSSKFSKEGNLETTYKEVISDRLLQLGLTVGGISENASYLRAALDDVADARSEEFLVILAQNVNNYTKTFGESSPLAKRYYNSFTQGVFENKTRAIESFTGALESLKDKIKLERIQIQNEEKKLQEAEGYLDTIVKQRLDFLVTREEHLSSALSVVKKYKADFTRGLSPWTYPALEKNIQDSGKKVSSSHPIQSLSTGGNNPLISQIILDWSTDKVTLVLHKDVIKYKSSLEGNRSKSYRLDGLDQLIINELARISREAGELITPNRDEYQISLNHLTDSSSMLVLNLDKLAKERASQLKSLLENQWNPSHPDLNRDVFPIVDSATYDKLSSADKRLALVVYAPGENSSLPEQGFKMGSIYVIAKGAEQILRKVSAHPNSPNSEQFMADFRKLQEILKTNGFIGYPGTTYPLNNAFAKDFIFEAEDYYFTTLKATREDFTVHGTKRFATLEFTNMEQRILAENKIDTAIHEDLLKWRDEFNTAQVDPSGRTLFDVPKPTQNTLLSNFLLSTKKYFRGDERKIIHWGLDLSGGKTVQIQLRDRNNRIVTNEVDIKQGINELYSRVNKMGVSEVSIRQEGSNITLDFPGSQGISAAELVKASSMYFHIVNEKFTPNNGNLSDTVNRFLQEIWNEAVVTNKKDVESINLIAWNHLYGEASDGESAQPRSEAARILYEQGLKLSNPKEMESSSSFNDTISKIALIRGDSFTDWQGQTNPLLIVFRNYALEGSNLQNIHASYDPSKGNFLGFEVKGSYTAKDGQKLTPRNDLSAWTSTFSKEKVLGSPLEQYSGSRGWRMAVILNGTLISSPTLDSPLRDSAMITGSFTQREINKLEADLKAGSLTFAPHILSEKNVSPELGIKERYQGIIATTLALVFVILLMSGYYRFAGIVASGAVIINLLIMWATLQNISATLTLASLAGVILTVGMAVDANVLVFERIREEFKVSGRLSAALNAGYKKAYSAIIDSNITTIIAAVVLLNFDSGPIKGFAITLIIGIVSSMFTALFLTRFFFTKWVQNPKHKTLNMLNLIKSTKFNFLKYSRLAFSGAAIIAIAGAISIYSQKNTLLGMDFTGGFALNLELEKTPDENYRRAIENALTKNGASTQNFQVRELTPSNQIRIFFGKSMEEKGSPFFGMPIEVETSDSSYAYETNPRINWVISSLEKTGVNLTPASLAGLDKNWTSISGQMSDAMRNNALIGLSIAMFCILFYITIRFEFKYAIAATMGLVHDVILTISILGVLHALGLPMQIDLNTIAALMTIIGYSLNDTIIVFDRIREDLRKMRKSSFSEVINHALNVTLSRTLMTSGTTLVALLALVCLGGSTIFGFAFVMTLGVVIGTLSSLFIASPIMLFFHKRESKNQLEAKS